MAKRPFITAVSHENCSIPLILDAMTTNIAVNIQLALLKYIDQFNEVQIIGDCNGFNLTNPEPMERQADGTFVYSRNVASDTVSYQLMGLTKEIRSVNGTQGDYYVYDGGGDYRSVLKIKQGTVKITFDPTKL